MHSKSTFKKNIYGSYKKSLKRLMRDEGNITGYEYCNYKTKIDKDKRDKEQAKFKALINNVDFKEKMPF